MATKQFQLSKEQIQPLINYPGACFATDQITVEGYPVGLMYREEPDDEVDSGWRFLSGFESDQYMDDVENHGIYTINTIANYDQSIIPFLDCPIGSAFERDPESEGFVSIEDWDASED